jgi:hypothetical protein
MSNVSKPILGLLLSAVVLFALVMVVFKPSSSSSPSQGAGAYQSAINQAHGAVKTSNAANAKLGAPVSTTPAPAPARHSSAPAPAAKHVTVARASKPARAAASRSQVSELERAVTQHKVVGLLFYNPSASDDAAVKTELATAKTTRGVVKLAVPVSEVSSFMMITNTIPVTSTPTLIVIDRHGNASTINGFADRFEIAQRLDAALSAK